jgi:hypothetical protein
MNRSHPFPSLAGEIQVREKTNPVGTTLFSIGYTIADRRYGFGADGPEERSLALIPVR